MYDVLNTLPLPAITIDKNNSILNINNIGLTLFNNSLLNIENKHILELFPSININFLNTDNEFETTHNSNSGVKRKITLKYCAYHKEGVKGIIYIVKFPLKKEITDLSCKKLNYLKKKIEIYDSFLNQLGEGVLVTDKKGQLVYVNANSKELFKKSNTKIKKYFIWDFFDYCNSKQNWEKIKKRIELNKEEKFVHTDKIDSNIILSTTITSKIIDNEIYYLFIFNDISESINNQIEINQKNKELQLIHKNIPATIFEFKIRNSKHHFFSYISESLEKTFSITIKTNDLKWYESIHFYEDDFKKLSTQVCEFNNKNEDFNFIGRFLINETIVWFEINANVISNENEIILNGIIQNITERKNAEDEIKNKTEFNNSILFNIPADIAVFDKNHNYLFINPNGIKNDELRNWLIGKNDFDYCELKGVDDKMAKVRREYFNKAKATRQQVDWIDEINNDRGTFYIYRRFFPFYVDDVFVYMIGYGIDVTELKQSQNLLNIQNNILVNKNKELERFTYIASHDLQEPLLSIIGFAKLLENEYYEKFDDDGKMFIDFIINSTNRMRMLISGLMENSRINKKEDLALISFEKLIEDVKIDLNDKITNYKAVITHKDLPSIYCYPTFIRMLIQNLISNAIKFTKSEIIPTIKISSEERELDWIFKVEDNGIGISSEKFEEVFLLFKRVYNEQMYEGYGIGLAHCRKIAEIHDGNIWVESTINVGSTFYFTISKNINT